jgi:AAA15 family ATPase/GTPase
MDEIDDALIKISNGLIKENETTMISTATKNDWNTLFDNLDRGMYPNTIIILTSNFTTQEIAKQCKDGDTSLLREKRVSDYFKLEHNPHC